jgi:hypothetical protein
MTQADSVHSTPPLNSSSIQDSNIAQLPGAEPSLQGLSHRYHVDKVHAEAFRELEGAVADCANMGRIVAHMILEEDGADETLSFAAAHLYEMLTALQANYYAAWPEESGRAQQ